MKTPKYSFCKFCGAIEKQKYRKLRGWLFPIWLHRCEQGASMMPLEQKAMIEEIVILQAMSMRLINEKTEWEKIEWGKKHEKI